MSQTLSANTQAILLLTAPLLAGRTAVSPDLLTPKEYKQLARHLLDLKRQPADLISTEADDLRKACQPVVDGDRLGRLLQRGFLLSQAVERWQSRAIWVLSRADPAYPRPLKARLQQDAPAVLYGCGDPGLLSQGGLAVVGSRDVTDALIDYTRHVGALAAQAGRPIVSGGARGVDQAAMLGALEAGGHAAGMLADSLEKAATHREHRAALIDGRLVLASPFDPAAGFNVGHAMQRNRLIYALADAALVVNSDEGKGGTWAGATEQLDKLRLVPVYVRASGQPSVGLDALKRKGAVDWPEPGTVAEFEGVFGNRQAPPTTASTVDAREAEESASEQQGRGGELQLEEPSTSHLLVDAGPPSDDGRTANPDVPRTLQNPSDALFERVREILFELLRTPMKDGEVAASLEVSTAQAHAWLERLVAEGLAEKTTRPARYVRTGMRLRS